MKNAKKLNLRLFAVATAVAAALFFSCNGDSPTGSGNGEEPGELPNWDPAYRCEESMPGASPDVPDRTSPDLGLSTAVVVTYDANGAAAVTYDGAYDPADDRLLVNSDGGHVTINVTRAHIGFNVVLSGRTANGSLKINSDFRTRDLGIYLNGADITNPDGPALNIQGAVDVATVHLVAGCDGRRNLLTDSPNYITPPGAEQAKGTLFSERELVITGGGSLEIRSKHRHAIVVDNTLTINNGNIIIYESAGDGIHTNRSVAVNGGKLQIKSVGDAVQVERGDRHINISGGDITIFTTGVRSHGLASDSGDVFISGNANIGITTLGNGSKGIRSRRNVSISGGTVAIRTAGGVDITPSGDRDPLDPDTTSNSAGIRTHINFEMTAGTLTVNSTGDNSRGINTDGHLTISGGNVRTEAINRAIDVDGNLTISGGTVYAKSVTNEAIRCRGTRTVDVTITEINQGGGF